jgi:hypothetical protein
MSPRQALVGGWLSFYCRRACEHIDARLDRNWPFITIKLQVSLDEGRPEREFPLRGPEGEAMSITFWGEYLWFRYLTRKHLGEPELTPPEGSCPEHVKKKYSWIIESTRHD